MKDEKPILKRKNKFKGARILMLTIQVQGSNWLARSKLKTVPPDPVPTCQS